MTAWHIAQMSAWTMFVAVTAAIALLVGSLVFVAIKFAEHERFMRDLFADQDESAHQRREGVK